jgi:predicted AAA+ superfamily ATPase
MLLGMDADRLMGDAIIELADGRWAALESKLSQNKVAEGVTNLMRVRNKVLANPAARNREPEFMAVLVKDVMTRQRLNDVTLVKSIAGFLSSNIGSPVSVRSIANTLSSNGRPTGIATVERYLDALADSYLFYKVQRYDIKGKVHLKTECKYYICDTGLRNMMLKSENKDIGHQIENIVYLELLRRGHAINMGKAGRGLEVDFVAVRNRQTEYYQVSASVLDEATLARELAPLEQIGDNYPKYIVSLDGHTVDHSGIRQVNLIDWLG